MTNHERADQIAGAFFDSKHHVKEWREDLAKEIERALDEAEKRGELRGFVSGKHMGQREMRERAAKEGDKACCVGDECGQKVPWCRACLAAKNIRALKIEGE